MKFNSYSSNHLRIPWFGTAVVSMLLLPSVIVMTGNRAMAHHEPVANKTPTIVQTQTTLTSPSVQKVAMHNPPPTSTTQQAERNTRLLGYGLFLLQIGLIPLKLSKGHVLQLKTVESRSNDI